MVPNVISGGDGVGSWGDIQHSCTYGTPTLKMHPNSVQLRCVIQGERIREDKVYDSSRSGGDNVRSWDNIQHSCTLP